MPKLRQTTDASANNRSFSNCCCIELPFFWLNSAFHYISCGQILMFSWSDISIFTAIQSIWNDLLRLKAEASVKHRSLGKLPKLRWITEASLFGRSSGSCIGRSFGSGRSGQILLRLITVFVYLSTDGITWCNANFAYFNLFCTVIPPLFAYLDILSGT